jgi:hypothetical protein
LHRLKNTIKSAKRSVQDFFLKLILSFQAVKLNAKCKLEGTVLKPREEAIQVKTYLKYFLFSNENNIGHLKYQNL